MYNIRQIMKKNILIIGGVGFIGSHLVNELVKNKNNKITVIDDLSTGKIENILNNLDKIDFIKQDLFGVPSRQIYDEVYMLAAKVNDRNKSKDDYCWLA